MKETILALPSTSNPLERTRYKIVNHPEVGYFAFMTLAMIWATRNLKDDKWRIEPVPLASPEDQIDP